MRSSFFAVSCVAVGLSAFVICGLIPSFTATMEGIELSSTSLNYGQVGYFEEPTCTLVITNTQPVPVSVQLEADCTCVGLSRPGAMLQATESMEVVVTMRRTGSGELRGIMRRVNRTVIVHYSMQGNKQLVPVTLTAEFIEPLVIDRDACVARAFPFAEAEMSIGISGNVQIHGVSVKNQPASCSDAGVVWNKKFNAGQLVVRVEPLTSVEGQSGWIQLEIKYSIGGVAETQCVDIPLVVEFQNPVLCEPPLVVAYDGEREQTQVCFSLDRNCSTCRGLGALRITSCPAEMACDVVGNSRAAPTLWVKNSAGVEGEVNRESAIHVEVFVESHNNESLKVLKAIPVIRLE